MLKLAGIEIDLLITERQNHAYEIMSKCDLSDVDVILTVGGDGILFEVINGLYTRDDVRNSTNPVPVFPIPGLYTNIFYLLSVIIRRYDAMAMLAIS